MIASCCSARSARPAYQGPPPMREPRPSRTSRARGPITASGRTTRKRKRDREDEGEAEARQGAADRSLSRVRVVDEVDPRGRPDWRKPLVEAEAREPRDDLSRADLRRAEGVAVPDEPLREEHAEERDGERAEPIEEVVVGDEADCERGRRPHHGDGPV